MNKIFNVWAVVEEINEEKDDNGKDINALKLAQFKTEKEADRYLVVLKER
jgi:hypothetical protein